MNNAQRIDLPYTIHPAQNRPIVARLDWNHCALSSERSLRPSSSGPFLAAHLEDHKPSVERRVVAVYVNWGLDVCPYEVPVRLSSGIPKGETIAVPSGMLARLYVFACFRSSFEAAALEPRINPSRDLTPQANVRTHQCIDLCMIQFPPALAKSLKGASRRPRELEP